MAFGYDENEAIDNENGMQLPEGTECIALESDGKLRFGDFGIVFVFTWNCFMKAMAYCVSTEVISLMS